ncbi:MAG: alkyl hydroperoxide reductase subunit F [Bacteroidales bacterium]|nr:alkyl hydroperoxide reductase subunit F [Bacteroidales bacterium]
MLETSILEQVKAIFSSLESKYVFKIEYNPGHPNGRDFLSFVNDVASCSDKITTTVTEIQEMNVQFSIIRNGEDTGIRFRGIPNGHEFTSLLLAVLNADGKGKNLPDKVLERRINALKGPIKLQTYVSLTCTNCPDVVQALNVITLHHKDITHEMIDGAVFQDEVDKLHVQAVPTVYANGKLLHIGRGSLASLLTKLEETFGTEQTSFETVTHDYDVIVVGSGPAGSSAAIYSARKGLKVAVVAERVGGQVRDTFAIENLISVPQTTGPQLAQDLKTHMEHYAIDIYDERTIKKAELHDKIKKIYVSGSEVFQAPAVIIATGAGWRKLNVPGEADYIGHGVAFCPHCDGPLFKGKHVAVVGGGNSGIEAAIDLAGICSKVTVFEFLDQLKADTVLQEKLHSLPNVEVFLSTATVSVNGDGAKVTSVTVKDRNTEEQREIPLDGIFVQIGLAANSGPFRDQLETSRIGEIVVDATCRTAVPGVYAAGDCSTVPYKQIIIAMGEGAKAALSAFDDRIKGVI